MQRERVRGRARGRQRCGDEDRQRNGGGWGGGGKLKSAGFKYIRIYRMQCCSVVLSGIARESQLCVACILNEIKNFLFVNIKKCNGKHQHFIR